MSQTFRIAADSGDPSTGRDAISGNKLSIFQGNALTARIAIFDEGSLVTDFSAYETLILEIKLTTDTVDVPARAYIEAQASAINDTLVLDDWKAGTDQHFEAVFTTAQMSNLSTGRSYLIVRLIESDTLNEETFAYQPFAVVADEAGRRGPDETKFKGLWNAKNNLPKLFDSTGSAEDRYQVSVAGTTDFGSGPISFLVGHQLVHNGSIWERLGSIDPEQAGLDAAQALANSSAALALATENEVGITDHESRIDTLETSQGALSIGFDTKATMDADLNWNPGTLAYVTNDPTPANIGMYRKTGASGSGSWVASDSDVESRVSALEATDYNQIAIDAAYDLLDENGFLGNVDSGVNNSDEYAALVVTGTTTPTVQMKVRASDGRIRGNFDIEVVTNIDTGPGNEDRVIFLASDMQTILISSDDSSGLDVTRRASQGPRNRNDVAGSSIVTVNSFGVTTYYSDPRSIILASGNVLVGFVDASGYSSVTHWNVGTGTKTTIQLSLVNEQDDHNNPGFAIMPDGKVIACYSKHNADGTMRFRVSSGAEPVILADWGAESTVAAGTTHSYGNPLTVGSDVFNLTRVNDVWQLWKWNGTTFANNFELFKRTGFDQNNYPKYCTDGSKLWFIQNDGKYADSENTSICVYYIDPATNNYYNPDGTLIKGTASAPLLYSQLNSSAIPFQFSSAALGTDASFNNGIPSARAWTHDIFADANGDIWIAYQLTTYTDSSRLSTHRIHYYVARWNGSAWRKWYVGNGGWGISNDSPRYSGGICFDRNNVGVFYISTNEAFPFAVDRLTSRSLNDHHELWRGEISTYSNQILWHNITVDSSETLRNADSSIGHFRPMHITDGTDSYLTFFSGSYEWWDNGEYTTRMSAIETSAFFTS